MNVFRYKFSETFLQHLKQFTYEHYTEDTITYRLSWNAWVLLNTEIINSEMKRLKSLGYDGNIEKKMYKSTRYWYKNKINKANEIINSSLENSPRNLLISQLQLDLKNNSNFKNTMKTNVKNEDIIEGDYEVIKDEDKK